MAVKSAVVDSRSTEGRMRIAVLAGGDSPEREVSLQSGRNVTTALSELGHEVVMVDPSVTPVDNALRSVADVMFPMVHGTGGEDGVLQRKLEALGLPFVGSDSTASALTFDKVATRARLQEHGIPVAGGLTVSASELPDRTAQLAERLGLPLVVKPAAQGSSVGVSIVRTVSALAAAVALARSFGDVVLIERFIPGREITVPVIDGTVFPPVEIHPQGEWYDYRAKYLDDQTRYRVGFDGVPAQLGSIALGSVVACGVTAISRVDFRVTPEGQCVVLEINTIPGMTSHSLVPMSAAALGLSPGRLCEQSIHGALSRFSQGIDEGNRLIERRNVA